MHELAFDSAGVRVLSGGTEIF